LEYVIPWSSWKVADIQRGLEHGSRRIAIVGAVIRKRLVKTFDKEH
jgi:hypothetical protein